MIDLWEAMVLHFKAADMPQIFCAYIDVNMAYRFAYTARDLNLFDIYIYMKLAVEVKTS